MPERSAPPPRPPALRSERPPSLPTELAHAQAAPSVHTADRSGPHRFRRAIGLVASLVGTALMFVAAFAGGTVLHVGVAPARRITSAAVNELLAGTFRGKLVITRLGAFRPNEVDGVDLTLSTYDGEPILAAEGVHARLALGPLVWSLVKGGDMKIAVTDLTIDHVDVLLARAPDGQLTAAEAFQPAVEGPPPPPDKNAAGLDLALPKVALRTAWVHGSMSGTPIDATIEKLAASFSMTPKTMGASGSFGAQVRALTKADPIALTVNGTLDSSVIDARLTARSGTSTVDLSAHGRIPSDDDATTTATVKVAARDVDAESFGGPKSKLGVDTDARVDIAANGGVTGKYEVHVLPGVAAAEPVPEARIHGTFTNKQVLGSANVAEAGAPVELRYEVALGAPEGPDVVFDLTTRSHDLTKIPQARGALKGTALIEAKGHALLGSKRIDAHVVTQVENFSAGPLAFAHATADAVVHGSLAAPEGALLLNVSDLRVASLLFPVVSMSAYGSPRNLRVDAKLDGQDDRHILLGANVAATDGIQVRSAALNLRRANDSVTATVASISSRDGRIDVEGIHIDGAGAPLTGEAHVAPGTVAVKVVTTGLDLGTIARLVEGEKSKRAGRVALDVDVKASKTGTRGHADIDARGVTDGQYLQALNATIATTFAGRTLDAKIDANDAKLGHVVVATEGAKLHGGILDPDAFPKATGKAHAELEVDLAEAARRSPIDLPIQEVRGRIVAKVDASRGDAGKRPSLALDLSTEKLDFSTLPTTVPNDDGSVTVVKKPFHSQGIDAHVVASVDGATGDAKVDAQLRDKVGPLLQANAGARLPVDRLLAGGAQEALLATAATFHAEVPMRSLDSLPPMLGTLPIRGNVAFTLDAKGDAHAPRLTGELKAQHVFDADDPTPIPIDLDTKLSYDGKRGVVTFTANRPQGQVLDGKADVAIAVADLLGGKSPPPWEANADIKLKEMPIGALADFANQEVDGNVSGEIALHDLHKAGALNVKLALDRVVLAGAKFPHAAISVDVSGGKLAADARIEEDGGFAAVSAGGAMKWGDEIAPSPDATQPAQVKLAAKNFRLIAFAPFLQGALDELDGVLNADATLQVKPGFKDGALDGTIAIDKGVVESPAVGEEFHDLKAQITMQPWGTWHVNELSGRATSGRFTATAQAKVDGFHLASAEAHLKIDEKDKIPLTMQGTALGRAWGNVDVKGAMSKDGRQLDLDVSVPKLHVDLEDATGHFVESTDLDPTITVGMHDKHGTMERLPFDGSQAMKPPPPKNALPDTPPPMAMHMVTHLGPDLDVRRGTMLKVYLADGPTIDTGVTTKLSGDLRISQGYVELQGKRFQIEDSKVIFTGQAVDNPLVQAAAFYVAPDAEETKVTAKFVGPLKTGKVTLESEPKLTDAQILSLLMFGTSDGTFGQSAPPGEQGNDTTEAASVAGGVVTEGLNKAISGVSGGLEIQTAVDTQETGNPRPEVEVALSRKVSATVMYSLGVPPPGDNPDDTLLLINWRFHGHYSMQTTLGDKGTTILDLAWKYRY